MAIQSFSENSAVFLKRGDVEAAARNNSKVADLASRMARIIKNFRTFARQERDTVNRVDLVAVVRSSIDIAAQRLQREGVELDLRLPDGPVWVQGGDVRLQQVVLNLITNAVDAMEVSARKLILVSIESGPIVTLAVSDTGPGIEAPEKLFEPFYTTKEIGEAEGVGLGLSISYGLVQSFGGNIRGRNNPDGGAHFTVELKPWTEEVAA
jgi:two-component system C4-dicarboxylate transport sensor histidine kinase DctB